MLVVDKHEDGGYVTPIEVAGEDATYVSRIRENSTSREQLSLWVVSDNLRKGARAQRGADRRTLVNRKLIQPEAEGGVAASASSMKTAAKPSNASCVLGIEPLTKRSSGPLKRS